MSNAFLQNLECAICLDVFEEPRILTNCGHTLCHQCIVSMLKRNKNDNTLSIICPTCFKETKLVNNDIKCLKINFQLLTVLDTVNKKKNNNFKYPRRNVKVSRSLPNIHKIDNKDIYSLENIEEVEPIVVKAEPISEQKFNDINSNNRSNYCKNFFSSIFNLIN